MSREKIKQDVYYAISRKINPETKNKSSYYQSWVFVTEPLSIMWGTQAFAVRLSTSQIILGIYSWHLVFRELVFLFAILSFASLLLLLTADTHPSTGSTAGSRH